MVNNEEVKKRLKKEINEINEDFGASEQIRKYKLMEEEWTIQTRELTANLKLRRKYICEKYKDVIEYLFR